MSSTKWWNPTLCYFIGYKRRITWPKYVCFHVYFSIPCLVVARRRCKVSCTKRSMPVSLSYGVEWFNATILRVVTILFWIATPCRLVDIHQRFGGTYCPLFWTSSLKMEMVSFSETLISTYESTQCNNPEQHCYLHVRENLKCPMIYLVFKRLTYSVKTVRKMCNAKSFSSRIWI